MLRLWLSCRSSPHFNRKLSKKYCLLYRQRTQLVQGNSPPLRTYQHKLARYSALHRQLTLGLCTALATPAPTSLFYACASGGARTRDQQVMSLLLYQLSYQRVRSYTVRRNCCDVFKSK